jgi:hypothetical protein
MKQKFCVDIIAISVCKMYYCFHFELLHTDYIEL